MPRNTQLREEAPGILAWAVRGCLAWQQAGRLTSPAAVQDAVEGYRQEMDLVQDFINEACLLDPTEETPANDLYGAYQRWCEQIRETPQSSTAFGKWLSDHGFQSVRTSSSARKRQGLRLKESVAVLIPLAA